MDTALRPMSASQILDRTFHLYRSNFLVFAGIAAVGPALTVLGGMIQLRIFGMPAIPQPGTFDPAMLRALLGRTVVGGVISLILYTLGQALASGATVHAVSMLHLGKSTTIVESYRRIRSIFGRILGVMSTAFAIAWGPLMLVYVLLLGAAVALPLLTRGAGGASQGVAAVFAILAVLLTLGGLFVGLGWAIYASCRYALAIPACAVENLRLWPSLKRSWYLSSGNAGRIFGIFLLTGLMSSILTSVLQLPAFLSFNPFNPKPGALSMTYFFWAFLGEFLGRTLAGPIATIAPALIYYDARVRKEAFDLQLMMESMGQAPALQGMSAPASGA
jgi:hypothetical protein